MKTEKYLSTQEQMKIQLLRHEVETLTATISRFTKKRETLQKEIKQIQQQIKNNGINTN